MLVVKDIETSKQFYKEVLGLHTISDMGAHAVLTGGLSLQTEESWRKFTGKNIAYGQNDAELYFEEDDFDKFMSHLQSIENISYVHPSMEHTWGQRVVRIYDPDMHIIEVGENIKVVCKRFLEKGMNAAEIAQRMDVPIKFVNACLR